MLVDLLGLPKQLEVLLIIIVGVTCLSFDSSLFDMQSNLEEVWNYRYHPNLQEYYVEICLKYVLSGVIFIRTFTTHIFLALYIVMLWPAIFICTWAIFIIFCIPCITFAAFWLWITSRFGDQCWARYSDRLAFRGDRPNLMVPWLVVGSVRSLAVNLVTLLTGSYVCITEKGHHPVCFDYFVSQIIQHGPSLYAWLTVLRYYKTLQVFCSDEEKKKRLSYELALRRRKARSMDSSQMNFEEKVDDGRNLLSESTLGNLIHQLEGESLSSVSRSLDSLLKLKSTKEAKDEIMYSEIYSDDEQNISILERAMKLLNVEDEDILRAMAERANVSLSGETDDAEIPDTSLNRVSENEKKADAIEKLTSSKAVNKSFVNVSTKTQSTSPEAEVELSCISFEPDASKVPEQRDDVKGTKGKMQEECKPLVKHDFLEKVAGVMQNEIKKMTHFGCQVGTLNRSILNQPAEKVTKKFRFSKKILLNAW